MSAYADVGNAQFENVNSLRRYPFSENSSLMDSRGYEIPSNFIVDLRIVVPREPEDGDSSGSDSPAGDFHVVMTSAYISQNMISACFKSGSGEALNALSVSVSANDFRPYSPYRLEKLFGSSDIGGVITFGDFDFPSSAHAYFLDNAEVHNSCVSAFRPPSVRRFIDRMSGESVSGDVDIEFSGHLSANGDGRSVRISIDEGSAAELASECAMASGSDVCGATPIRSINGIRPDDDGNIVIWFH